MSILALMLIATSAFAGNDWTVPCKNHEDLRVHLTPDFRENFACKEGTGTFAHQYYAVFKDNASLRIGERTYSIKAGADMGLEHRISCELVEKLVQSPEANIGFFAADDLRNLKAHFYYFDGFRSVDLYANGVRYDHCEGRP